MDRVVSRLYDILQAIADIRSLLSSKTSEDLSEDRAVKAALERFIEIISEASRHIPPAEKANYPSIPWQQIAGIGNHIRHAYNRVDPNILWSTYRHDLDPLESAVRAILVARPKEP
jgi:uncharacterized protein with HEPN domain